MTRWDVSTAPATYDRLFDDILMVQDDIAAQAIPSLTASIKPTPKGN